MLSKFLLTSLLLTTSALAQQSTATPAHSSALASATASSSSSNTNLQDTENLVQYLLPSAPTSLSPAQASLIQHDASAYLNGYTQSNPIASLEQGAVVGAIFGGSIPNAAQQSSIQDLLNKAGTAALANPSAYIASVEDLVNPFGFAGQVTTYANGLMDGLRTVIASDLSVAVPTPTSSSSKAAAERGRVMPTGVAGAAAAAVIGAAGMLMA